MSRRSGLRRLLTAEGNTAAKAVSGPACIQEMTLPCAAKGGTCAMHSLTSLCTGELTESPRASLLSGGSQRKPNTCSETYKRERKKKK